MRVLCLFQKFSFKASTIYLDLVNELEASGHEVYIIAGSSDADINYKKIHYDGHKRTAYVKLPDQFHADKIRKGLIQLTIGRKMLSVARKFFWKEKIDLIIYPTPPITLAGIISPLKRHYGATAYLMLKDIFPQNAVDLKMMNEGGFLHKYFRKMEKKLYSASDKIGCMSQGNLEYIRHNEGQIDSGKLEIFPNTVRILPPVSQDFSKDGPVVFMFGGNLGKPQAIDFLMDGIKALKNYARARFEIIGDGTEADYIANFIEKNSLENVSFATVLPRDEYEAKLKMADVGIVMLSPDFTIPNYPSRILSYMQLAKPVLAVTDRITDIHALVTYEASCGWWCPSDNTASFVATVRKICEDRESFQKLGQNGRKYLEENFDVKRSVTILEAACKDVNY